MAPRTRNSIKTKKQKKGRKKRVHFHKKEYFGGNSQTVVKPPENYENLILYYLTKLKRLFGSTDHAGSTVTEINPNRLGKDSSGKQTKSKSNMHYATDTNFIRRSSSKPKSYEAMEIDNDDVKSDMESVIRNKAFNIVNSAIEYGFANNVLEKRGNYFIIKKPKNSKIANRQPTPGPNVINKSFNADCKCPKCRSQKSIMKQNIYNVRPKTSQKLCRDFSNNRSESIDKQTYHFRSPKAPLPSHLKQSSTSVMPKRRSRSCTNSKALKDHNRIIDCTCSSCRMLKQKMIKK